MFSWTIFCSCIVNCMSLLSIWPNFLDFVHWVYQLCTRKIWQFWSVHQLYSRDIFICHQGNKLSSMPGRTVFRARSFSMFILRSWFICQWKSDSNVFVVRCRSFQFTEFIIHLYKMSAWTLFFSQRIYSMHGMHQRLIFHIQLIGLFSVYSRILVFSNNAIHVLTMFTRIF
jgi:hypothetical protein